MHITTVSMLATPWAQYARDALGHVEPPGSRFVPLRLQCPQNIDQARERVKAEQIGEHEQFRLVGKRQRKDAEVKKYCADEQDQFPAHHVPCHGEVIDQL